MLVSECLFEVLNEKTDYSTLIKWILGDLNEGALPEIRRSDFALYFLNYLQDQTSSVIESCPPNRRDGADCVQTREAKRNVFDDGNNSNDASVKEAVVKRAPGHVRKIFASPGDKTAAHSLKRVTPQPCETFPYNQHQRNGLPQSASFPGSQALNNPLCLSTSAPMIYDPRLGYNVPYFGNRNYNNYYHHQQPNIVPNIPNQYTNGSNYVTDRSVNPNFSPLPHQFPNYCVNPSYSSPTATKPSFNSFPSSPQKFNKGYQVPKDINMSLNDNLSSPQKLNKEYQSPKTPVSSRIEPKTPNSNSSCSSGVSLMSPESPLYSENFPMMGSNERRNIRRENTRNISESADNSQSRKHSHNKKRIKPILLNKTGENNGLRDEFGKKTCSNSCDDSFAKFPERKQNFFDDKVVPNCQVMNLGKTNAASPEFEKSSKTEAPINSSCLQFTDSESKPKVEENNDRLSGCRKIEDQNEKQSTTHQNYIQNNKVEDKASLERKSNKAKKLITPDPSKVNYKIYLTKLAEIYCALLDANLIPNITAEVYFIFSLLTVDSVNKNKLKHKITKSESSESCEVNDNLCTKTESMSISSPDANKLPDESVGDDSVLVIEKQKSNLSSCKSEVVEASTDLLLFDSVHQCVYFACAVLSRQKDFLIILDKATLKLLMKNNRLSSFTPETVEYLKNLFDKKDKELRCRQPIHLSTEVMSINPVPFQMELDNRDTFSTESSFHMFRKQRDALYEILQIWNEKHDKRDWNFNMLSLKIERLFLMSADPVNMRHLARHFCDLLLKTIVIKDNETEGYAVSGMPEIDKSKLNRLTERLIRPSISGQKDPRPSPDFPGLQAFYHDFLVIPAANYSFHTHVVNSLAERINLLNGTSFQFEEPDFDGQIVQEETRFAFLKCLQSLCVLAKFLGLVVFSPYYSSSELPQSVLQDEVSTRNKILPPLDLRQYLVIAEDEGRLVQTVPWIIEYLGMMDTAAPLLVSYQTVLNILFSLYLLTAPHLCSALSHNHVSNEISSASKAIQSSGENSAETVDENSESGLMKRKSKFSWQTAVLLRLSIGWLFDTSNFSQSLFFNMASSYKEKVQQKVQAEEKWHNITVDNSDIVDEKLLQEFCPYLVNLKVCLADSTNNSKQGPMRHITPVPSQQTASCKILAATTLELQLEENFFMGQSESLRRTVDFVAERAASACIKHICSNIIVSLKNNVLKLKVSNKSVDLQPFIEKYNNGVEEEIENVINQRLNIALSALLGPDVIEQSLNGICQQIAARKLRERVVNWLQSHINISEILLKLQMDGSGHNDSNNSSQNQNTSVPMNCLSFSDSLILMQDLLNDVLDSRGNEGIKTSSEVVTMFKNLSASVSFYCDNTANIKLLLSLVLDYLLLMVTYRPRWVTSDVLEEFCKLWKLYNYPGPLSRLLSPRNMMLLAQGGIDNRTLTWEKFGLIIASVLTHDVLSISNLEAQAVAFFQHSWPNDILKSVSKCLSCILEDVGKHRSCINDPKFVLMLELCSDMAADMNNGLDDLDF